MKELYSKFGMSFVLIGLVLLLTLLTWSDQAPSPLSGAKSVATQIKKLSLSSDAAVLIVHRAIPGEQEFAENLKTELNGNDVNIAGTVEGDMRQARLFMESRIQSGLKIDVIAVPVAVSKWLLFEDLASIDAQLKSTELISPKLTSGSTFLSADNLKNVFSQISIVAIMAIGMTMVIISGGIDLSVGSLTAFSAVFCCWLIDHFGGGMEAGAGSLVFFSLVSIIACCGIGLFNGFMVTKHRIPPFIMTLAMMLIARGFASIISKGQTIQVNEEYNWLGTGATLNIPNTVILMAILFAIAYMVMNKMRYGRHLYAVGGNIEAAHLSGVSINKVLMVAYLVCGGLAGLGGIILASQFNSGAHTYGLMYELKVIAAVVVGGTSLSGGQGHVLGTLIGALIIAVIENGMNLLGLDSYVQNVVLGFVILSAVWIDSHKKN